MIKIKANRLGELEARMAKLNKRANKLGCGTVGFKIVGEEVEEHTIPETEIKRSVKMLLIEPTGEAPVLAGWKLISRIEHPHENANLLFSVPGEETPESYRTVKPVCDHCGKIRRRKDTFVVQNVDTNEYKQVGSSCLRDFLGHSSPEHVVNLCTFMTSLSESMGEDEEYDERDSFMKGHSYVDSLTFLSYVTMLVEKEGWKARSSCAPYASTASMALDMILYFGQGSSEYRRYMQNLFASVTKAHKEFAKEALEWMANSMPTKSDYQWNLQVAAAQGTTTHRNAGILASGIVAYTKHLEHEIKRREYAKRDSEKSNEWLGVVGERKTFNGLTVMSVRNLDSNFGVVVLYRFEDAQGNVVVWFSSGDTDIELGKTVSVTGRIKKLDSYQGRKQTVLTRCKVELGHDQASSQACGQ